MPGSETPPTPATEPVNMSAQTDGGSDSRPVEGTSTAATRTNAGALQSALKNGGSASGTGSDSRSQPRDRKGWDGKLRVAGVLGRKGPGDAGPGGGGEGSDDDDNEESEEELEGPTPEQIDADEDLLDDYPADTDEIDLVHCRISSIPALRLERFTEVAKLCLRQNAIQDVEGLACLARTLEDLDLYDNLIGHIKGLEDLVNLTSLDLSFNKIKHIKKVDHLKELRDIYFVQNKIGKIEGLDGLVKLRNLELAANRIREIENLDHLTGLEELWLGKNKITELKNLSPLTNLKILSIQSNRLTSLSNLEPLLALEELYVSHNGITEISGLDNNKSLRVLDISNNRIAHLQNLSHLTHLEELWASNNQIASFDEVERELKDKEELETVYFEGNPMQLSGPAVYRNKVRLALPRIKQIDASEFSVHLHPFILRRTPPGFGATGFISTPASL
ncbi:MAG: hypothetical protein M4579_007257 [Chaenotheca gracillima]|nr:MAG: hypothetical protein M4579_007257 [Chaenotheca gracillima]